jgi:hypothetical protein
LSLSSGIRLGPGEVRSPRGDVAAVGASTRLFVVGAVLLAAAGLGAQTTGDIRGRVTDSTGAPLADAIVEVEGAKMQGSRRGASAHDGTYRVLAVPAGAYRVRGSRAGFRAVEKPVTVSLDATATVDFELAPAAAESVTVVADGESLDLASTTTGSSYTERLVARLPVARNYADVVRANPGVGTDNAQGQGRSLKLTVYGATSAENAS